MQLHIVTPFVADCMAHKFRMAHTDSKDSMEAPVVPVPVHWVGSIQAGEGTSRVRAARKVEVEEVEKDTACAQNDG